jgi:hypothetical protein
VKESAVLTPHATPPALTRGQAVIVWTALFAMLVLAVVLSTVVELREPDPALARTVFPVIALMSVAQIVAGPVVLRSMRKRAAPSPELAAGLAGTQMIVACSLAMGVGLFAAVLNLLTRERLFLAFAGAAAAVLVWWFPSEARWARLSGAGAARTNPMMRG